MKIEHVDMAANEVKAYRRLLEEIDHFNQMRWFRVFCGTDNAAAVLVTPEAVGVLQSGSNGALANKVQEAVREHYATRKRLAEESLKRLGVALG